MNKYIALVEWHPEGKTEISEELRVPVPICHQKSHTKGAGLELEPSLNCLSHRTPSVFSSVLSRRLFRTEYRSRKLEFLGLESYTSRMKSCSPMGDIDCRLPSFPLGCTYCDSMVTICHGNRTTVDRSLPSRIKDYTKRFTERTVCTIGQLILRLCIKCREITHWWKEWPNRR